VRIHDTRPLRWALVLAVAGGGLASAGQSLPSGREVVARHVEAIGGEQAYEGVTSLVARGLWEIPAQGISGALELQTARPNKLVYRVTVAGIGRIENGFDGAVAWSRSPIAGPELLTGRQLSEAADEAWFDGALHRPEHVPEVATLGLATFDDRSAYRVRVVFQSGNEQVEFFDVESGFHIGTEAVRATPQGEVPTVNILRDYEPCGPILQPTRIVQRALGFEQVVTVTSCEVNAASENAFILPPEVEALREPAAQPVP